MKNKKMYLKFFDKNSVLITRGIASRKKMFLKNNEVKENILYVIQVLFWKIYSNNSIIRTANIFQNLLNHLGIK